MIATDPLGAALGREFAERLTRGASYDFDHGILPTDSEIARAARRPLAISLAAVLDAGRGRYCGGAIAGSAFSSYRIVRMGRLTRKLIR